LRGRAAPITQPTTMQNEAMRWGHLPLAGESGANE
jgi:hypothetical protein